MQRGTEIVTEKPQPLHSTETPARANHTRVQSKSPFHYAKMLLSTAYGTV
jgi:hypothetical protein